MQYPSKLLSVIAAAATGLSPAVYAQGDDVMEEVIVRGIRGSLEQSIDIKRDSTSMVEAITADDIGKMPDQNIAESLQRLPGVQIDRRDGVGTQVRIRGLSQNITLLNGESFFSGMENFQLGESQQQFTDSLESIPSELLGGVEVYKTPDASMVEGAMGGIVNLKTREALDLDDTLFAANVKMNQGMDAEEAEPSAFIVLGDTWGDFGAIFSLTSSKRIVHNDIMQNFSREGTGVRCTDGGSFGGIDIGCVDDPAAANPTPQGQSYMVPGMIYITDSQQERERTGAALNLQWQPTDAWEFGLDYFHSELDLSLRQYSVKHPMNTDNATGIDETESYSIAGGTGTGRVGVLQNGVFTLTGGTGGGNPGGETNSGGDKTNVEADNFAFNAEFDDGGSIRYSVQLNGATTELEQRSGWSDQRFSPYAFHGWTGDTTGGNNGYGTVIPNQVAGDSGVRTFSYNAGGLPNLAFSNGGIFTDPQYWTHKSHWALGSNFEQDFFAGRFDLEWDVDAGDLRTLKFGLRQAEEEAAFDQLRWLNDFSRTSGALSPTSFDTDGSVASASSFDPSTPPVEMNVGVQEARYFDLCGNGGIPASFASGSPYDPTDSGDPGFCDIDGDGISDNSAFGPYGYFVDAAIGLKAFDLQTSSGIPMIEALYNPTAVNGGVIDTDPATNPGYTPLHDTSGRWPGMGGSPNYLPWETFGEADPRRYIEVTNFFPSGGYRSNILFEDAESIVDDPEEWIDNVVTPGTPGEWIEVPVNTWEVKETTTAFYVQADFEGESVPYVMNVGLRAVNTEVDVTHAEVLALNDLTTDVASLGDPPWAQSTDFWNGQGALLPGSYRFVTETRDYWDALPSLNFVLNTSDDTKLRFSMARVISRPNLQDLGRSLLPNYTRMTDPDTGQEFFGFTGGTTGNPNLDPFRANQGDIAYEWYFGDLGLLSVGAFVKSVESFIQGETQLEFGADSGPGGGRLGGVNRLQNGSGGSVSGLEFAFQQSWESGFGMSFNYTYSDSKTDTSTTINADVGLPGVSEHAYNLTGFYDKNNISARLAWTWRDEYLSPQRATYDVGGLENGASEFFNDYGQLDANITWDVTDQISLTAEAINITDENLTSYLGYSGQPMTYTTQEPRIVLGVNFRL